MSTDSEIWNANMLKQMRLGFPWEASPTSGVWYLQDSRGQSLARFNLDSGHAARLAAAAPDLYEALEELMGKTKNGTINIETWQTCQAALAKARGENHDKAK